MKQDNTKTIVSDSFFSKIESFLSKSKFLQLMAFQYSTRWRDSYCIPLKKALEIIDIDVDGIISHEEFVMAIDKFNKEVGKVIYTQEEAEAIFAALDFNNNGQIEYIEFQTMFASQALCSDEVALQNEFKRMDLVGLILTRTTMEFWTG